MVRCINKIFRRFVSLPAQRDALDTATDYEFMRVRRLGWLVFGYVGRWAEVARRREVCEKLGPGLLMMFGELLPVLVAVLRKDSVRHGIVSSLPGLRAAIFDRLQHQA